MGPSIRVNGRAGAVMQSEGIKMDDSQAVLVTTVHRGVFFGYLPANADRSQKTLTLKNCRNAIYWAGSRGFLGLASHGPDGGSRIGTRAPEVMLHDITSVTSVSDAATMKWEKYAS